MAGKHGSGHNLLYKLGFHVLGCRHSYRPCYAEAQAYLAELMLNFVEIAAYKLVNPGIVALVARKN